MNLANRITILRILLTPLFVVCLIYWQDGSPLGRVAAAIFLVACLTDALDGFISSRFGQITALGSLIDPLADKLLLMSAYLGLAFFPGIPEPSRIPAWLTVAVISRDLILLAGAATIYAIQGKFEPRTNLLGKATTLFQMLTALCALWGIGPLRVPMLSLTCALTVLSGLSYLHTGARMLPANGMPVPAKRNGAKPAPQVESGKRGP